MIKKVYFFLLFCLIHSNLLAESSQTNNDIATSHIITIEGKSYHYTSHAGTITLYNKKNKATVQMFYTANTLDGAKLGNRPITFFYNGGPGSSSMLLRMGSFGPKRVLFNGPHPVSGAPYQIVDNEFSLIDKTDLVFIDMPGTGFGRLTKNGKSKDFYTVDNDVKAFSDFIQHYIQINQRWNSPKFLFGESYGTTRTAILVNELQHKGIQINGVVLQSSILNYGLIGDRIGGGDWQYILYLPSLAATAWHFNKASSHAKSLSTLMTEVENFAINDYLSALAKGSTLPQKDFDRIAKKLHDYLGISIDTIKEMNLRISSGQFAHILLKTEHERLGRFDSRFVLYSLERGKPITWLPPDPTGVTIRAAVLAANNEYLRNDLNYITPLTYKTTANVYNTWDFRHKEQLVVNASFDLANAMVENPALRVFSANGYYDFATPFFATIYTLQHLDISPILQNHITYGFYESGHMIYLDAHLLKQFKKDLAIWYDLTLSPQNSSKTGSSKK